MKSKDMRTLKELEHEFEDDFRNEGKSYTGLFTAIITIGVLAIIIFKMLAG